jgi:hypothetical protein
VRSSTDDVLEIFTIMEMLPVSNRKRLEVSNSQHVMAGNLRLHLNCKCAVHREIRRGH